MKVKSESEVSQLCLTPSDPTDCRLLRPWDFPGKRVLEWVAIAFSDCSSFQEYMVLWYSPILLPLGAPAFCRGSAGSRDTRAEMPAPPPLSGFVLGTQRRHQMG